MYPQKNKKTGRRDGYGWLTTAPLHGREYKDSCLCLVGRRKKNLSVPFWSAFLVLFFSCSGTVSVPVVKYGLLLWARSGKTVPWIWMQYRSPPVASPNYGKSIGSIVWVCRCMMSRLETSISNHGSQTRHSNKRLCSVYTDWTSRAIFKARTDEFWDMR
jgi:hypothetical protein